MTRLQPDLFGTPLPVLPEGMAVVRDAIDASEERHLTTRIDASGLAPFRFHGWLGKRLTASFGHGYDFERGSLEEAPPLPEWLVPLRDQLAAGFGLDPADFVQALVIRYDPGAGIGWHRDRPQFHRVLGLSLGNATEFRMRRRFPEGRFERLKVMLEPRSAYLLDGPARSEWQHEILPVTAPRWSVTFRSLRS